METSSEMGHVPGRGETGNGSDHGVSGGGDDNCWCCSANNFQFAFNVASYSDRSLRLEIVEDSPSLEANMSPGSHKRRRESNHGDSGSEVVLANMSSLSIDASPVLRVENIHISSMLLAAKSAFFRGKFSAEMGESESRELTLRIPSSQELAFTDLLKFMYSNMLSAKTPDALLNVFTVSYDFKVNSGMKYCTRLLQSFPLTCDLALSYLSLPPNLRILDGMKQLVDAAYDFLPDILRDIAKYEDAALKLPLDRIKVMMSSDHLRFDSEDAVYDFIMKWLRLHFQDLKERREVFQSQLCHLVRFPHMSYDKLMTVLYCIELDQVVASEIVLAALFSKGKKLYVPRFTTTNLSVLPDLPCLERAYMLQPVRVIAFDAPYQECIIYLDLKKEECELGPISTQDFQVGNELFYLGVHRNREDNQPSSVLGLYLYRKKSKGMSPNLKVECEIAVRLKNTTASKFATKKRMMCTFKDEKALGFRNLLDASWDSFIAEDSRYFINGIFHIRANIKIEQEHLPSQ